MQTRTVVARAWRDSHDPVWAVRVTDVRGPEEFEEDDCLELGADAPEEAVLAAVAAHVEARGWVLDPDRSVEVL